MRKVDDGRMREDEEWLDRGKEMRRVAGDGGSGLG